MNSKNKYKCSLCGGAVREGRTTFTAELGFGIVVIRDVNATVCTQCGTDWIDDSAASKIESIIKDARKKHLTVEITSLSV